MGVKRANRYCFTQNAGFSALTQEGEQREEKIDEAMEGDAGPETELDPIIDDGRSEDQLGQAHQDHDGIEVPRADGIGHMKKGENQQGNADDHVLGLIVQPGEPVILQEIHPGRQ